MTNGTRRGWGIRVTPRPLFTPGKDPVSIVQEAGWAPGPVWTGAENLAPTGIRSPERPARSQLLYGLSYRGPLRCTDWMKVKGNMIYCGLCCSLQAKQSTFRHKRRVQQHVFHMPLFHTSNVTSRSLVTFPSCTGKNATYYDRPRPVI